MKRLDGYILEKLRINQDTKVLNYHTCHPKDYNELKKILRKRLTKDKNADLNDIDVSKITDMHNLFYELNPYDIKIDKWDISNVEDMSDMFYGCKNFNCDLSKWDISNAKDIWRMFQNCQKFEGKGLENWNVSNVEDMEKMFYGCDSLKNKPSWYKE